MKGMFHMTRRFQTLGIVLALIGLGFIVGGGVAYAKVQAGYDSLKAFSGVQNVQLTYNDDGQLLTGTLMDYALPKAHYLPEFTLGSTVTPSPVNPMGVKGVGEAGTIASTPCAVNAVCDALSQLGVRHIEMPLKPERVFAACQRVVL